MTRSIGDKRQRMKMEILDDEVLIFGSRIHRVTREVFQSSSYPFRNSSSRGTAGRRESSVEVGGRSGQEMRKHCWPHL